MNAVIMSGGKGTRLRPLTNDTPKPLVSFLGRPVLEHQIELLRRHGITDIIITVGHLQHLITEYFGDGRDFGVRIRYIREDRPLGTAGGVKQAEAMLSDTFVVISGDAVTDVDLQATTDSHLSNRAEVTLVLKEVEDTSQYGVAETGLCGRITRFQEKPAPTAAFANTANTGMYVMSRSCLRRVPNAHPYDFGKQLFPHLLKHGARLFGHTIDGNYWNDIGSLREYLQAHMDALEGRVNLPLVKSRTGVATEASLHPRERVMNDGSQVGRHAFVGEGARVGEGTTLYRCVINRDCVVGHSSILEDCVLSRGTVVPPYSVVRAGKAQVRGTEQLDLRFHVNREGNVVALAGVN